MQIGSSLSSMYPLGGVKASKSAQVSSVDQAFTNISQSKSTNALNSQSVSVNSVSSQFSPEDLKEINQLLNEIFGGVQEQLDVAKDLDPKSSEQIQNAAKEFQAVANNIFKEANGKPLTENQIERLVKADDKFHAVVDKVHEKLEVSGASSGSNGAQGAGEAGGESAEAGAGGEGGKKKKAIHPDDLNKDGTVSTAEKIIAQSKKAAKSYQKASNSSSSSILESLSLAS